MSLLVMHVSLLYEIMCENGLNLAVIQHC